jgi:hypothetical protein
MRRGSGFLKAKSIRPQNTSNAFAFDVEAKKTDDTCLEPSDDEAEETDVLMLYD